MWHGVSELWPEHDIAVWSLRILSLETPSDGILSSDYSSWSWNMCSLSSLAFLLDFSALLPTKPQFSGGGGSKYTRVPKGIFTHWLPTPVFPAAYIVAHGTVLFFFYIYIYLLIFVYVGVCTCTFLCVYVWGGEGRCSTPTHNSRIWTISFGPFQDLPSWVTFSPTLGPPHHTCPVASPDYKATYWPHVLFSPS